jgi:hypothetical protein
MANADSLLTNLKDRAAIPPASVTLTDSKLLTILSEELQGYVAPLLASLNDEYFSASLDRAIVSGTQDMICHLERRAVPFGR